MVSGFIRSSILGLAALLLFSAPSNAQSTKRCVVAAANADAYSYSTAVITSCRINTGNGQTSYEFQGKARKRAYIGKIKMSRKFFDAAKYWSKRYKKFSVSPNPAGFDVRHFLTEAAKAEDGMVFVRDRRGAKAYTVVFITDGVYRSIDFKGTDVRDVPFGFLSTE